MATIYPATSTAPECLEDLLTEVFCPSSDSHSRSLNFEKLLACLISSPAREVTVVSVVRTLLTHEFPEEPTKELFEGIMSTLLCLSEVPMNELTLDCATEKLKLISRGPRRVCQYPFRKNDIVWICRTCQADETCVLCNDCFTDSNHDGHEVYFYHAQAGGCCDCGDPDAWDPNGFCTKHGHTDVDPLQSLPAGMVAPTRALLQEITACLVEVSNSSVAAYHAALALGGEDDSSEYSRECLLALLSDRTGPAPPQQSPTAASPSRQPRSEPRLKPQDDESNSMLSLMIHNTDMKSSEETLHCTRELNLDPSTTCLLDSLKQDGLAELARAPLEQWQDAWSNRSNLDFIHQDTQAAKLYADVKRLLLDGFVVSLRPHRLLTLQRRISLVLPWLHSLSSASDGMSRLVCQALNRKLLQTVMRADAHFPKYIALPLHALLLSLMADQDFKMDIAKSYATVYQSIARTHAIGVSVNEYSLFTLSVQFLNRATFVNDLVEDYSLLSSLSTSLKGIVTRAVKSITATVGHVPEARIVPSHPVLTQRRYTPVIADIKCVLNIDGMSRRFCVDPPADYIDESVDEVILTFARRQSKELTQILTVAKVLEGSELLSRGCKDDDDDESNVPHQRRRRRRRCRDCIGAWLDCLAASQLLDQQQRVFNAHVEFESRQWMYSFNMAISLSSVFENLLSWVRRVDRDLDFHTMQTSPVVELLNRTHDRIDEWSTLMTTKSTMVRVHPIANELFDIDLSVGEVAKVSVSYLETYRKPSFHFPLHRFWSNIIHEACKAESLVSLLEQFALQYSNRSSGSDDAMQGEQDARLASVVPHLYSAAICPLHLASQVRCGMWKKNGYSMQEQVLNYAEPPFCRMFRDLDFLLLQWAVLTFPFQSKTPVTDLTERTRRSSCLFVNTVLTDFGVWDYFFHSDPTINASETRPPADPTVSPDMQKLMDRLGMKNMFFVESGERKEYLAPLAEELLLLLIQIVTELPLPPCREPDGPRTASGDAAAGFRVNETSHLSPKGTSVAMDPRTRALVRREIIHKLAVSSCTHSEVYECCSMVPKLDQMENDEIEGILHEVAEERPAQGLEPAKFSLRASLWSEYDPTFYHLTTSNHQRALESRPSSTIAGAPIVATPPPCHPLFQPLRSALCLDLTLLRAVSAVLQRAVKPSTDDGVNTTTTTELLLSRALHWLTLSAHTLEAMPAEAAARVEYMKHISHQTSDRHRSSTDVMHDVMDGKAEESDVTSPLLCLRSLLKSIWARSSAVVKSAIEWLLKAYARLDPQQCQLDDEVANEEANESRAALLEAKKKAAKERALKAMEARVQQFMQSHQQEESDDDEYDDGMSGQPECIVCREFSADKPLGYVALLQPSHLGMCQTNPLDSEYCMPATPPPVMDSNETTRAASKRRHGGYLSSCGHAIHFECHAQYFATIVAQSAQSLRQTHIYLNLKAGEFPCPLCKQLANMLVPHFDSNEAGQQQQQAAAEEETMTGRSTELLLNTDGEIVDWFEAIVKATRPVDPSREEGTQSSDDSEELTQSAEQEPPPLFTLRSNMEFFLASSMSSRGLSEMWRLSPSLDLQGLSLSHCSLAYTVAYALASHEPKGASFDPAEAIKRQLMPLKCLARSIQQLTRRTRDAHDILRQAIAGQSHGDADKLDFTNSPLLHRNLLETFVGMLGLNDVSDESRIRQILRTMYIALITQLLVGYRLCQLPSSASLEVGERGSQYLNLASLLSPHCSKLPATSDDINQQGMLEVIRQIDQTTLLFVKTASVLSFLFTDGRVNPCQGLAADAPLTVWLDRWALPQIDEFCDMPHVPATMARWIAHATACLDSGSTFTPELLAFVMRSNYPQTQLRVISLPTAYSELHSVLSRLTDEHHVAICLICGQVLPATGQGDCTRHAEACCAGNAMFFLLQECSVLLMHEFRAAYFASPYVDDHGEKHGQFRGRPLFCDPARLKVLSDLVASHQIPVKIAESRSTSRQVIVANYY